MWVNFRRICVFLLVLLPLFPKMLFGADERTAPMDMYLILDGSATIKNAKDGAVKWVCDSIVDGMLQNGDTLTIWIASEKAEKAFSAVIDGPGQKETVKNLIRSVSAGGSSADFAGALREAASMQRSQGSAAIPYTLLITGSTTAMTSANAYLRYARVEEFSGWRAVVAGLALDQQIQQAASAYMSAR
jgi:hypothetical protein